jgi:hypothetical protein
MEDLQLINFRYKIERVVSIHTAGRNQEKLNVSEWAKKALFVLVVRGFFNWLASAMLLNLNRSRRNLGIQIPHLSRIWYGIAQEAAGTSCCIKYQKTTIKYERFKDDRAYRQQLCEQLGGLYSEDRINLVPSSGGGSSFDGMEFADRGSEMDTGGRCIQMMESEFRDSYVGLIRRQEDIARFYADNFEMEPSEKVVAEEIFEWR